VFVSVRLTQGRLISGALANRMTGVRSGRWYRLNPFGGTGVGRRSRGARVGSDTLLGPEETDRLEAAAVGWRPRGLLISPLREGVGAVVPRLRDRPSITSAQHSPSRGVWVSGDGSGAVAVCCLRFA
jgi:hypothetical protein